MVVLDASVLLQIPFDEEFTEQSRLLLKKADSIEAPHILWYEVGNGLVKLFRRKMIEAWEAEETMRRLMRIPIKIVEADRIRTLRIATELQLTFYDAAYVDVALQVGAELYTADKLLCERARTRVNALHISLV